VWRVGGAQKHIRPSATRLEHLDKVRDLQVMRSQQVSFLPRPLLLTLSQTFVTTSHDRTIRFWDLNNLDVVKSYSCGSVLEISCMVSFALGRFSEKVPQAVDERLDLVAVGSRRHLHLVDRRSPKPIANQSCRADHEGERMRSKVCSLS
jgi:WD40 repeat protein